MTRFGDSISDRHQLRRRRLRRLPRPAAAPARRRQVHRRGHQDHVRRRDHRDRRDRARRPDHGIEVRVGLRVDHDHPRPVPRRTGEVVGEGSLPNRCQRNAG
ncbi:MAG: hypothetical protein ACJ780_20620, partial [Solirubrobacteraceae bacterium]